jgi:hypothetical protein
MRTTAAKNLDSKPKKGSKMTTYNYPPSVGLSNLPWKAKDDDVYRFIERIAASIGVEIAEQKDGTSDIKMPTQMYQGQKQLRGYAFIRPRKLTDIPTLAEALDDKVFFANPMDCVITRAFEANMPEPKTYNPEDRPVI